MVLAHVEVAVVILFLYCVARNSCGVTATVRPSVFFVSSDCLLLALCSLTVTLTVLVVIKHFDSLWKCDIVMLGDGGL